MISKIPTSRWVLERRYFKVKLVKDFRKKYIEFHQSRIDEGLVDFLYRICIIGIVEVYQWPSSHGDEEADYFEREDDNHVIPRHLFTVLED